MLTVGFRTAALNEMPLTTVGFLLTFSPRQYSIPTNPFQLQQYPKAVESLDKVGYRF